MNNAVTNQPVGQGMLIGSVGGHRDWSTGLFDCFSDIKSCLMGVFLLPCMVCSIASRQGDCPLMPYCVLGSTVALRARIRTLGGIRGNICSDCLVMTCLPSCAFCQMQREMDNMGL